MRVGFRNVAGKADADKSRRRPNKSKAPADTIREVVKGLCSGGLQIVEGASCLNEWMW